jgi:hypothetical protein
MVQKTINITGDAKNISGHAALVAENIGTYYIDGMGKWKEEWVNKKIKVIGDLGITKNTKENIIKHPVVQLL